MECNWNRYGMTNTQASQSIQPVTLDFTVAGRIDTAVVSEGLVRVLGMHVVGFTVQMILMLRDLSKWL